MVVTYSGRVESSKDYFASSYEEDEPHTFNLSQGSIIRCWEEGLLHVYQGMYARLLCPPDFAYGSTGVHNLIPPDSNLIFDVVLIGINRPETDEL